MPVLQPQSDSEFNNILLKSGTTPVIADFFATWCQPCNMIAPFFQELANKYPQLTYAKVDGEKLKETALRHNVMAYPTFIAFLNGQKMDSIRGADKAQLEAFVKKWVQNCPSPGDSRVPGQASLNSFINGHQVECLNEDDRNTLHMLLSNAGSLISDCDEQLIINLPFNQQVKVHSVYMKGPAEHAPRIVKVFANIPNTLDFDKAQSTEPIQTLDFSESEILPLRFVKFQNVTNLQLFVESNKGDNDKTVIEELRIYGMPLTATNMEEFKRVAGKAGEVGH
uniref:Thioredoxin-like protein 1 n=1 Tax=Acrobeloides nanus TaxID=290746 RepID=A0A914DL85_9BILA